MINRFLLATLAVALAADNAIGHPGRRFEIVVRDQQLAAHGYNSGVDDTGGSPRAYLNALHGEWENSFGTIAITDLPGFDVFAPGDSVVGSGAAAPLAGSNLTLTLVSSSLWENPSVGAPGETPWLTSYRTGGAADEHELTIIGDHGFVDQIGESLTLAQDISTGGEVDLDLDFTINHTPSAVLKVLEWELTTTAAGIAESESLFLILAPDPTADRSYTAEALQLERYLSRPLLPGDFDRNGTVDTLDYNAWRGQFGHRPVYPGSGADANADGLVDPADYTLWRDNLGTSTGSLLQASTAQAPEPSAVVMLLGCWLLLKPQRSRVR